MAELASAAPTSGGVSLSLWFKGRWYLGTHGYLHSCITGRTRSQHPAGVTFFRDSWLVSIRALLISFCEPKLKAVIQMQIPLDYCCCCLY